MNALNLYSNIEQYLDFSDEVEELYGAYKEIIKEIDCSSLIDIGCGQGDFLLQIQNKNLKTFGIDLSSEQIKVCQEKNLPSQCIDIADVKETYSCATAIFDVLNYMDKNTLKSFLKATYDVIEPKGYFIFDVNTLFGFEEVAQGTLNINLEDKFIALDAFFENNKLTTNITLFQKKENNFYTKNENHITQHFHSKDKLLKLLANIGFNAQKVVHFNLHEDEEADKYIFICTK
ncbi:MAG TPA: class I SAM-dependent methyltransferase [Arcobacter sp.]|nr:class I SAM-dependent methyltransferase [Arcobacter sp.]